ncbi:MAG: 50S ribosomal protein L11 methyltransferase [Pseudomonadota bacterium]
MPTFTALTTAPARGAAEALAEAVEALEPTGVGCFEIEDGSGLWEVNAYFLEAPDEIALDLLAAANGARAFRVSRVEDRDWVAQVQRELSPVRAGRVTVHGAHDRHRVPENRIGVEIEAAMAFGTGHHATTEGCLLALERLVRRGFRPRRVADIGCGTGVLAIAAARLLKAPVAATDLDAVAAATARVNSARNGGRPRVRVREAGGFRHPDLRRPGAVDLALMNILARPLRRLAPDAARAVAPGGRVILSGLLLRQVQEVEASYRAAGFAPEHRLRLRGWATLTLRRL